MIIKLSYKNKMIDKVREEAIKVLYKIDVEGAYSNIALNDEINSNRNNLNAKDIGFISELVYGTITWKLTLDQIIRKYSKIRLKKISPWIINILRIGIYQIVFLDKIPKSAAVNESVNLAKRYGHASSANFVNAILRKVEKTDYYEFNNIEDDITRISKVNSMPEWFVEKLINDYGRAQTDTICQNLNKRPNLLIRVNTLKIKKEELTELLKNKNIEVSNAELEDFLVVKNLKNIENLEEFKKGYFTIQDQSAGLASIVLDPQSGEYVLDACSAPGGKTTYLAQLMNNSGKIIAWDMYEHRLKLVNENSKRLGIDIIETEVNNADNLNEKYVEKFDKILLDVPCMGTGVIKRKPDIKWQREEDDVEEVTNIQYSILETSSKYLKINGTLVYSTCSILKEENEKIIEKFLQNNKNFEIVEYENINLNIGKNKYVNILPSENFDGFFIVKLKKK